MPTIKLNNRELADELSGGAPSFPKYVTQIINLANQNAQGTRPRVVGQMTDLFREFGGRSFDEWVSWYAEKKPGAIEDAVERVCGMVPKLRDAIAQIDESMVKSWVEDLVLAKTFLGLCFQEAILSRIVKEVGESIDVTVIVYEKKKTGLTVTYDL